MYPRNHIIIIISIRLYTRSRRDVLLLKHSFTVPRAVARKTPMPKKRAERDTIIITALSSLLLLLQALPRSLITMPKKKIIIMINKKKINKFLMTDRAAINRFCTRVRSTRIRITRTYVLVCVCY